MNAIVGFSASSYAYVRGGSDTFSGAVEDLASALRANRGVVLRGCAGAGHTEVIQSALESLGWSTVMNVVGTGYAKNIRWGALMFLLSKFGLNPDSSVSHVCSALNEWIEQESASGSRVIQVLRPDLLDPYSRTAIMRLASRGGARVVVLCENHHPLDPETASQLANGTYASIDLSPVGLAESGKILQRWLSVKVSPAAVLLLWELSHGALGKLHQAMISMQQSGSLIENQGVFVIAPVLQGVAESAVKDTVSSSLEWSSVEASSSLDSLHSAAPSNPSDVARFINQVHKIELPLERAIIRQRLQVNINSLMRNGAEISKHDADSWLLGQLEILSIALALEDGLLTEAKNSCSIFSVGSSTLENGPWINDVEWLEAASLVAQVAAFSNDEEHFSVLASAIERRYERLDGAILGGAKNPSHDRLRRFDRAMLTAHFARGDWQRAQVVALRMVDAPYADTRSLEEAHFMLAVMATNAGAWDIARELIEPIFVQSTYLETPLRASTQALLAYVSAQLGDMLKSEGLCMAANGGGPPAPFCAEMIRNYYLLLTVNLLGNSGAQTDVSQIEEQLKLFSAIPAFSGRVDLALQLTQQKYVADVAPDEDGIGKSALTLALADLTVALKSEDETDIVEALLSVAVGGMAHVVRCRSNAVVARLGQRSKRILSGKMQRLSREQLSLGLDLTAPESFEGRHDYWAAALTHKENRVLDLVAKGLSNAQVASLEGVSVRTVEGHLYQIYSKLSLHGRADLKTMVGAVEPRVPVLVNS
ncbi:helix-turn-helix transcriptional regulator [Paeniglutamicibacter terrestris]|uniref:helix-turn-helix transcriptional regulator n=1 Tax=Paeniglutamicibacter terrestris TaxID=2723403 RepID=UPI001AEC2DA6